MKIQYHHQSIPNGTPTSVREDRAKMRSLKIYAPPFEGIHRWLFLTACFLRDQGVTQESATRGIKQICAKTQMRRNVPDHEIESSVANAYRVSGKRSIEFNKVKTSRTHVPSPQCTDFTEDGWPPTMACPQPARNGAKQSQIIRSPFGLTNLIAKSPVQMEGGPPRTLQILEALYGHEELLCIGRSSRDFDTLPLLSWRNFPLSKHRSLIVPNPMTSTYGHSGTGKISKHTRDNTGRRRYIIIEFDGVDGLDAQAAILWHLKEKTNGRLVLAVKSGGKSLHGWFHCENIPPEQLWNWFSYAVTLGADPRLWLPEQFCRLPDGTRENGNRQSVVYFNPEIIK